MCREMALLGGSRMVIDGTYLKADANRSSFHTKATLERDLKRLDATIVAYLRELDAADAQSAECAEDPERAATVEAVVAMRRTKKALQERMQESGESQISEVDADARLLRKGDKTVGGYNCQIAVDVVQDGNDTRQLEPMMTQSRAATGSARLSGLADAGYFSGEQLKSCEAQGMEVYLPIPKQACHKGKDGRFGSEDFRYDAQDDTVVCPAGQRLVRSGSDSNKGKLYFNYRTTAAVCRECSLSGRCLAKRESSRRVRRWEHADVIDRHRQKMRASAQLMRGRGALVEHPFGTIKRWAGMDHFLMRGLVKCRVESGDGALVIGTIPLTAFPVPRSSNRTCGFPASGLPTRSRLRV